MSVQDMYNAQFQKENAKSTEDSYEITRYYTEKCRKFFMRSTHIYISREVDLHGDDYISNIISSVNQVFYVLNPRFNDSGKSSD